MADETLYHLVRSGELGAFDVLYGRYEGRLFGFLLRMVRNHHDDEDLLHEAFVNVLRSREVTFDRASFCTWLYRIGRNLGLNHLRARRRKGELSHHVEAASQPSTPLSAEILVEQGERAEILEAALSDLAAPLVEVYRLRTTGMSYEEIAEQLRIPLGTVKSRMNQLTQRLRGKLARRLHEPGDQNRGATTRTTSEEQTAHGLRRN